MTYSLHGTGFSPCSDSFSAVRVWYCYKTWNFIKVFTETHYCTISLAIPVQFSSLQSVFVRSVLILFSHLCTSVLVATVLDIFYSPFKMLHVCLDPQEWCMSCHVSLLALIAQTKLYKDNLKLFIMKFSLLSFFLVLSWNIPVSTLLSRCSKSILFPWVGWYHIPQ
jgi:hypothetical protein